MVYHCTKCKEPVQYRGFIKSFHWFYIDNFELLSSDYITYCFNCGMEEISKDLMKQHLAGGVERYLQDLYSVFH